MNLENHGELADHLLLLAEGELAADDAAPLRAHVDGCPECQEELASLTQTVQGLRQGFAGTRRHPDPAYLVQLAEGPETAHSHVAQCPLCHDHVRLLRDEMARAPEPAGDEVMPAGLRARLPRPVSMLPRRSWRRPLQALAASILLVFGVGLAFHSDILVTHRAPEPAAAPSQAVARRLPSETALRPESDVAQAPRDNPFEKPKQKSPHHAASVPMPAARPSTRVAVVPREVAPGAPTGSLAEGAPQAPVAQSAPAGPLAAGAPAGSRQMARSAPSGSLAPGAPVASQQAAVAQSGAGGSVAPQAPAPMVRRPEAVPSLQQRARAIVSRLLPGRQFHLDAATRTVSVTVVGGVTDEERATVTRTLQQELNLPAASVTVK
ncbi:MAG: anti-sigma factor [Candidatus Xenobia bacterium]